ncbi:VOC family protein [Glaciihabitans sp. UYNi722]|uniref:VOC family protein n=1 Tax=Glaciihabitans sp. UYNi722 TaxID=3156344 RepID=UPI0033947E9C
MSYRATVTSSVLFVTELKPSVDFYTRVLGCRATVQEADSALLLAPGGFQIYVIARGRRASHPLGAIGNQGLMWATETADELALFATALKNEGCYRDTRVVDGITFVEGRDPDDLRVVVANPSPIQAPRSVVAAQFFT